MDDDDFSDLPPTLAEIAAVAGREAALTLAEARGGTDVFIPGVVLPHHWLACLVGMEAAEAISGHFRILGGQGRPVGMKIALPLLPDRKSNLAKRVADADAEGLSASQIALAVGTTTRTVYRHLARMKTRRASVNSRSTQKDGTRERVE